MAKGAKRQKVKNALSPVRNLVSPGSSHSPSTSPSFSSSATSPDENDSDSELLDDLMAELDARNGSSEAQAEAGVIAREMQMNEKVNESHSSLNPLAWRKSSKSRHQARQERRAAELADKLAPRDLNAEAQLEREAKDEELAITSVCKEKDLQMHEISPDGHCLFSAIGDQLSLLSLIPVDQASYPTIRAAAAKYMLAHPDDFMPFLPSISGEDGTGATDDGIMTPEQFEIYCRRIAETGEWGGEPEIQALSRSFGVPIHVVQSGTPRIVVHEPVEAPKGIKPVMISYHRRMYGLGEHYNSLRPKKPLLKSAL